MDQQLVATEQLIGYRTSASGHVQFIKAQMRHNLMSEEDRQSFDEAQPVYSQNNNTTFI